MKRMRHVVGWMLCMLLVVFVTGCGSPEAEDAASPVPEQTTPTPTAMPVLAPVNTPPPAPTPITFPMQGYTNGEGVNIRIEPNKNADIVDIMGENVVLELVGREGDWYRVDLGGTQAFVADSLVTIGDPPRKHNMHWAKVSKKEAQLYKSPSDTDLSEIKLAQGESVKVLRKLGDYLHVVYNRNLQRYLKEADVEYISEEEFLAALPTESPAASASPSPAP